MDKSQILPNRKEYRASMRRFKHLRVAKKKSTKGAFGAISEYIREYRKKKAFKKNSKLSDKVVTVEKKEVTSTKEVKKVEPIEKKELNDVEFDGGGIHLEKEENNETDVVE